MMREVVLKDGERAWLRPATPDDAEGALALLRPICAEHEFLARDSIDFSIEEERAFLATAVSERRLLLLAVDAQGHIVGSTGIAPDGEDHMPAASHVARIGIALHRDYRGRGLGRAAVQAVVDWGRRAGYKKAVAEVYSTNARSLALFRGLGFGEEVVLRGQVCIYGRDVDAVLFALFLVDRASLLGMDRASLPGVDRERAPGALARAPDHPPTPAGAGPARGTDSARWTDPPPLPFVLRLADGERVLARAATPDDAPALNDVFRTVVREGGFVWEEYPFTVDDDRRRLLEGMAPGEALVVMAEAGGRPVGAIRGARFRRGEFPKCRHVLWISTIILPGYRGRGLGRVLVSALLCWAEQNGYRRAYAVTYADNRASQGMFHALGFCDEGVLRSSLFLHGRYIDDANLGVIIPAARAERGGFLPPGDYRFERLEG